MANLTLVIDDELLQQARIKALQQGTSVNEICREAISRFAGGADDADDFLARWRAVAARVQPAAGPAEPTWPGRERLYAEAMAQRLPTLAAAEPAPGPTPPARR